MNRPRRDFLRTFGLASSIWWTGCQSVGQGNPDPEQPQSDPETPSGTPTDTPTPQPEFKQEGTLYVEAADGTIGPDGFFDQGEQLDGEPDDYLLLETWENGEIQTLTVQELREKYQFNQYQQLVDTTSQGSDNPEIYQQFPEKLTDDQWVRENLIKPMEDIYIAPDAENPFKSEEYVNNGDLKTRIVESNYDKLWNMVAHVTLGGPSSGNDYIKTAALTGAEYHSAGRETATFNMPTLDGTHGLGFAITGATYNEEELEQQETWGIETDPGEDTPIWDLDEHESYPNDSGKIMIETTDGDGGEIAWKDLGMTRLMSENITVYMHGGEEFEQYLKNPDQQKGMKYIDSACIAGHINQEAHQNGTLPEFEDARLDVYPDHIEYDFAG